MMKPLLSTLLFVLLGVQAHAQYDAAAPDGGYPPPKAPFVAPVPENAQWTLAVPPPAPDAGPADPAAPKPRGPVLVVTTKTGKTRHDVVTGDTGQKIGCWFVNGQTCLFQNDKGEIGVSPLGDPWDAGNPMGPSGFPGVEWIKAEHFDKVVTFERQPCYHYLQPREGDDAPPREAWINAKTGLPVGFRQAQTFVYTFGLAPTAPLVLPAPLQQARADYQKKIERRAQQEQPER